MIRYPEEFRVTPTSGHRVPSAMLTLRGQPGGLFYVPAVVPGRPLRCIASEGRGWEHVSVSIGGRAERLPTWPEMDAVRHLFWPPEVWVVQFHPARSEHRSIAEALHLWRPLNAVMPTPPSDTVAPRDRAELERIAAEMGIATDPEMVDDLEAIARKLDGR